jgi:hypothetical protein
MAMIAAILALTAAVQDDPAEVLRKTREAREKCEEVLGGFSDAKIVGTGGTGAGCRIMISCPDEAARSEARKRLGGDTVAGVAIHWIIAKPAAPQSVEPAKAENPGPKEEAVPPPGAKAEPKGVAEEADPNNPWKSSVTDCDIIRDYLKMKRVSHPIANSLYSKTPCQLIHRSVIGAGGGHSYLFTKHRDDCPIRLGRVSQPGWADNFVAWVFQKGFTPAQRGGFLWPTELRADDKLWDRQASEEMKTALPYIREGAEWSNTQSGYVKVASPWFSGSVPTGGGPGLGWSWSQPGTTVNTPPPPVATPSAPNGKK